MPTTTMLHVRVDRDVKEQASEVLALMGLSVPEAVRLFLERVIVEQAIPFKVKVPDAVTRAAMEEARGLSGRFADADSLFDELAKTVSDADRL